MSYFSHKQICDFAIFLRKRETEKKKQERKKEKTTPTQNTTNFKHGILIL